jgi:hypothetical protein
MAADNDLVTLRLQLPGDPLRPGPVGAGVADEEVRRLGPIRPPQSTTLSLAVGLPQRAKRQATQPRRAVGRLPMRGYPHSAAGVLASAQARGMLLVASGPFNGLAHEPRRHGVQLVCRVSWTLRRAWRRYRSATALDRDDRRANERRSMATVRLSLGRMHHVRPRDWEAQRSASTPRCLS